MMNGPSYRDKRIQAGTLFSFFLSSLISLSFRFYTFNAASTISSRESNIRFIYVGGFCLDRFGRTEQYFIDFSPKKGRYSDKICMLD